MTAAAIHVEEQIRIERPREEVAAWAADPENAPRWRKDVAKVEWKSQPPLRTGSRIALTTPSLGLPLAYRYTVEEHEPGERTVLRTEEGPFPIETALSFADATDGAATDVTLTTTGEKKGSKVANRILERTIRRTSRKDLARLKKILESGEGA
jgi:uncharacterized membrane protein